MRNRTASIAATAITMLAAIPAAAQDGAIWRDDKGRQMVVGFAGGGSPSPAPTGRTAEEMADIFHSLCIANLGDGGAAKSEAAAIGLEDRSYDQSAGAKQMPWSLVIARGDGIVLAQADRFLSNPLAQCNVIAYLPQQPDMAAVEAALATVIGRVADNDAGRVKKNGKPNKYFDPEWRFLPEVSGQPTGYIAKISPIASDGVGIQFSFLATKD